MLNIPWLQKCLQTRSKMRLKICIVLLSGLLLAGCSEQTLYSKLSEREANLMVAMLVSSGLSATKASDKGGQFKVLVSEAAFADAVHLLHLNGLPRETYDNLGQVFAKEGFVSSPLEERARLNFALSQEIANTLSNVDGVLLARVHLAVPPKDELNNKTAAASASVFIKHRSDVDLSGSTGTIKNLVVNGIENLSYDDVTVAFFKSGNSPLGVKPVNVDALSTRNNTSMSMSLIPAVQPVHVVALFVLFVALLLIGSLWRIKSTRATQLAATNANNPDRGAGHE